MPNRLASASSPYLRQHADNPVAWYPWGEDAFQRAKAEQKPIFLSIGYATCHWCHVMARESFENPAIAAQLNEHFISIKVDREERPDVDRIYMSYVQLMTGRGGWPLSAWLTPELKPFFAGTYFPPEDRHGRAGFSSLLNAIAEAWRTHRDQLVSEGDRSISLLSPQAADGPVVVSTESSVHSSSGFREVAQRASEYFQSAFDRNHGGFGGAPKFPQPGNLAFLLRLATTASDTAVQRNALEIVTSTLAHMSRGGIHDHVGGGYHRYSVDDAWFIPHFEKMLYDQAQIASVALGAWKATHDERFAWMARDILTYVLSDLAHPEGAFYAAEDADSANQDSSGPGHSEGAFHLWKDAELREVLGTDYPLMAGHYGIRPEGNIPPELDAHGDFSNLNHLAQVRDLATTAQVEGVSLSEANTRLATSLIMLLERRGYRPRPLRDEKIVTAWNGLMISALSKAATTPATSLSGNAGARDHSRWHLAAVRTAEFIRQNLYDESSSRLVRSWCGGVRGSWALTPDYVFIIQGLLDLHEVEGDLQWLRWAETLQESLDAQCLDVQGGAWFDAPASFGDLVLRLKEDHDGAEPAPSSIGALNLLRLAAILGREDWHARALQAIDAFGGRLHSIPQAMPWMLTAVELAAAWPLRVLGLVGNPQDPRFRALSDVIHGDLGKPRGLVVINPATSERLWLEERAPWLSAMIPKAEESGAAVWICEQNTCLTPISDPVELKRMLQG